MQFVLLHRIFPSLISCYYCIPTYVLERESYCSSPIYCLSHWPLLPNPSISTLQNYPIRFIQSQTIQNKICTLREKGWILIYAFQFILYESFSMYNLCLVHQFWLVSVPLLGLSCVSHDAKPIGSLEWYHSNESIPYVFGENDWISIQNKKESIWYRYVLLSAFFDS